MKSESWTNKDELIRKLLKEIRVKKRLTQIDVAHKLNNRFRPIHQSFVSKYESGERALSLPEIESICEAIEVSLMDFVSEYQKRSKVSRGQ